MLKRKTPLRRSGGLKRSRLKRRNEERAAKRRAECFGKQADMCRQLPCSVCGGWDIPMFRHYAQRFATETCIAFTHVSDPHHEPTRSCGGKDGDTVPLCRTHHDERHRIGRVAFERAHGVDLRAVAKALRDELECCATLEYGERDG